MISHIVIVFTLCSILLSMASARPVADVEARQAVTTSTITTIYTSTYLLPTSLVSGQVLASGQTFNLNGANTVLAAPTTVATAIVAYKPVVQVDTLIYTANVAPSAPSDALSYLCSEGQLYKCNARGNSQYTCPSGSMERIGCPSTTRCVNPVSVHRRLRFDASHTDLRNQTGRYSGLQTKLSGFQQESPRLVLQHDQRCVSIATRFTRAGMQTVLILNVLTVSSVVMCHHHNCFDLCLCHYTTFWVHMQRHLIPSASQMRSMLLPNLCEAAGRQRQSNRISSKSEDAQST